MLITRSLRPLLSMSSATGLTPTGIWAKSGAMVMAARNGSPRSDQDTRGGWRNFSVSAKSLTEDNNKKGDIKEHHPGHIHEHHSHSHDSIFSSHVHSAHEIQDNPIISESGGLKNPAIRITVIGLITNLGMVIGKGIGGVVFNSQSLLADALHAVSDLVSDFLTLFTVTLSNRIPSVNYPLGYGKVETVGALGVSALLLFGGFGIGLSGIETILTDLAHHHEWINSIPFIGGKHSHIHNYEELKVADINAAWLALASIFVKEWLFRATFKIGKETKSSVLIANAWHHRVDSLTSMVAMLTITGGNLLDLVWLDSVGGILVAGMIIKAGISTARGTFMELLDRALSAESEEYEKVQLQVEDTLACLNQGLPETVYSLKRLTVMSSGPNLIPELEIGVSQDLTLKELNKVKTLIDEELSGSIKGIKGLHISYVEGRNMDDGR